MNLAHMSLEGLGYRIGVEAADLETAESREVMHQYTSELARRMTAEQAEHLLEFHFKQFQRNPNTEHWNQLVAMMAVHQHYKRGSGDRPANSIAPAFGSIPA